MMQSIVQFFTHAKAATAPSNENEQLAGKSAAALGVQPTEGAASGHHSQAQGKIAAPQPRNTARKDVAVTEVDVRQAMTTTPAATAPATTKGVKTNRNKKAAGGGARPAKRARVAAQLPESTNADVQPAQTKKGHKPAAAVPMPTEPTNVEEVVRERPWWTAAPTGTLRKLHEWNTATAVKVEVFDLPTLMPGFERARERFNNTLPTFTKLRRSVDMRPKDKRRSNKGDDEEEVRVCDCAKQLKLGTILQEMDLPSYKSLDNCCGDNCLNRLLFIECNSDNCSLAMVMPPLPRCRPNKRRAAEAEPPKRTSVCRNRPFASRGKNVVPKPAPNKGWGLFAEENILPGEMIIEYIGEILDDSQCEARLFEYKKAGVEHFHMMEITPEFVIDAGMKGNMSRFINHSCDPNCAAQRWSTADGIRIAMVALKPIAAGEEITYDYQLISFDTKKAVCHCGAANCRGFLGGAKKAAKPVVNTLAMQHHVFYDDDVDGNVFLQPAHAQDQCTIFWNARCLESDVWKMRFNERRLLVASRAAFTGSHDPSLWMARTELGREILADAPRTPSVTPRKRASAGKGTRRRSYGVPIGAFQARIRRFNAKTSHSKELNTHCKEYFDEAFYGHVSAAGVRAACVSESAPSVITGVGGQEIDLNQSKCAMCRQPGKLLCCDLCPKVYHLSCLGISEVDLPAGDWACPTCAKARRRGYC